MSTSCAESKGDRHVVLTRGAGLGHSSGRQFSWYSLGTERSRCRRIDPTTALASAGADEVSAAVSRLFGAYGQQFQALNARAATFHAEFVSLLNGGAAAYTGAEAASVSSMQALLDAVNAPTQTLLGRPLIGNGADGVAGTGSNAGGNGGPGGILYGNGGNGGPADPTAGRR
ncbi:PE-PGRS family protein PE_PGRS30 [Mycobacterium tuberculosis variant africanum]|nr:PE-PGRS family protein PE_PGRS30 [Mycobacterium tuberculosis variant africanum]